ncbi:DUF4186 domain-containing protein [Aeriscardovia aeriphila]|uniref:Cytoplasmic protein n=1 Tax=Aeriscardovia aeriphila TaxID=218139 RepID=A0A261FCK9_9BIFI|nr:DUF4186 domain-containing protein [Aeriscardovia aeriphila]NYI26292.1 hypothetical protein [Aeriscardovia aeriphila]OZG56838.1 hypothetical protein AEAE_0147 [Aeriscardovia aeriphila]
MVHNLDNAQQLSFDFDEDDNDSDNLEKFGKAEPVVSEAVMPVVSIDAATQEWVENCFYRLAHSKFRSSFRLSSADLDYALKKGPVTIHQHARQFLTQRLAAANPSNDGRQTPWRGHPVFTAQHATATCCRGCMHKWWGVKQGVPLTPAQIERFSVLIMTWISAQVNDETLTDGRNVGR